MFYILHHLHFFTFCSSSTIARDTALQLLLHWWPWCLTLKVKFVISRGMYHCHDMLWYPSHCIDFSLRYDLWSVRTLRKNAMNKERRHLTSCCDDISDGFDIWNIVLYIIWDVESESAIRFKLRWKLTKSVFSSTFWPGANFFTAKRNQASDKYEFIQANICFLLSKNYALRLDILSNCSVEKWWYAYF